MGAALNTLVSLSLPQKGSDVTSDVPARAWPESPVFGLAQGGSGFRKSQAGP
jgi:hypothetical protein